MRVLLTKLQRTLMLAMVIFQFILFLCFLLVSLHYTFYPFLGNFMPTLCNQGGNDYIGSYCLHAYNILQYSLFFMQHTGMAMESSKQFMRRLWSTYPLYQRYVFNICSAIILLWIFYSVKPENTLPCFSINEYVQIILVVIGMVFQVWSGIVLGYGIFMPYPISTILHSKEIQLPGCFGSNQGIKKNQNNQRRQYKQQQNYLCTSGIYSICRNPMQLGTFLLLTFASNIYTIDRILFIIVFTTGIVIGVSMEEKRLIIQFGEEYKNYMRKVRWKLIPFIY